MTPDEKTELIYLQDLVFESARWRISEDDELSPIEREVRDRLDRLQAAMNGEEQAEVTVPDTGCTVLPAFPQWGCQPEAKVDSGDLTRLNEKIKINYKGRILRLPKYMLEKEPCKASHTGYKWVVSHDYEAEADAKVEQLDGQKNEKPIDKLSDELWREHENS